MSKEPTARMHVNLGTLHGTVEAALHEMALTRLVARLWSKDHQLWKPEPTEIVNRLGWLTVADQLREKTGPLQSFAQAVRRDGFRDVVLLGMGGSSLGPEVLRCSFGSARGFPRLWVLDSTVPGFVRQVTKAITPSRTLFILASKSGGTIEVMSLYAHFSGLVARAKKNRGGGQFIAITDPGTSLGVLAHERGFRTTFTNPPDIGGRYSVLSYFGLVPAALMGLDVATLLARGIEMAQACRPGIPPDQNPGAYLGAVMGILGRSGRDKVTIVASPKISSFGLWAEQLLAESTGKEGRGLVPVAQEPLAPPDAYGNDRLFAYLRLEGDANADCDRHVKALERAGQPVVRLALRDAYDLAAEFFRWEFATAMAGHYLGIHPFDQPNVQESKENTSRVLEHVKAHGQLPRQDGPESGVETLLSQAGPGRYLAILAYLTPSAQADAAIRTLRKTLLAKHHLTTTAGYGPRYLHSTGQLHKGGPNSGLFLQLIEDMKPDMAIPGQPYTFGTLAQAQAAGDYQSLQARHRAVVRVRLGSRAAQAIKKVLKPSRRRAPAAPRATKKTRGSRRGGKRQGR
jgi:glucose-6-phosphate isomerase/transaldolase/glucose-6-phosphate isomerase